MRILLLAIALVTLTASADAQRGASPFQTMKALKCAFSSTVTADWTGNDVQVATRPNDFSFQITNIDQRRGRARITGSGGGSAEVTMSITSTGMNLIEPTRIGNFNLLSIFGVGGADGKYLAVFSQHLGDLTGSPSASQAYGSCESAQ